MSEKLQRRLLLLAGSPSSEFYCQLSELYARGCLDALSGSPDTPARYAFVIAHVSPDGTWRFPLALTPAAIAAAETLSLSQAIGEISRQNIDVALPQMFCPSGMTDYRALLELMGIPYLGNRPWQMALAADKARTKAIVAAAGVCVPDSQLLAGDQLPELALPLIVKPNDADNSEGVTLLRSMDSYAEAARRALRLSDRMLVEQYIEAGREVRCGVVEREGRLQCLPLEEYFLDPEHRPIRCLNHKLAKVGDAGLSLTSKTVAESWIVEASDPVVAPVNAAALACHRALGCRQYSLFDFRIDPLGVPWFLEAGLYCSFAPHSVLVTMMEAAGTPLCDFFDEAVESLLAP